MQEWKEPDIKPTVWAYFMEGEDPFLLGFNGYTQGIDEIEKELISHKENYMDYFPHGDGTYMFSANYEPAQIGEYYRTEIDAYWDITLLSYKPNKT